MASPDDAKAAPHGGKDLEKATAKGPVGDKGGVSSDGDTGIGETGSIQDGEDILALQHLDPALNLKMHLVNNVSSCRNPRSPRGSFGVGFVEWTELTVRCPSLGYRRDWMDELPLEAVLPQWIWVR